MSSVNKVMLVGHLGADPDVRVTGSGDCVTTIRLATTEVWKDKSSGDKKEQVDWHRVVFYGRLAEIVRDYLKKGRLIFVEGRLHTRKWQDQQTGQDRYMTEVVASEMKMLSGGRDGSGSSMGVGGAAQPTTTAAAQEALSSYTDMDDDIPF